MGTPQIPLTAADLRRIAESFKAKKHKEDETPYRMYWCPACQQMICEGIRHKLNCVIAEDLLK